MPGLGQWLPDAVSDVDLDTILRLLVCARPTTRQRTAYLLGAAGNVNARSAILGAYSMNETAWFGPRVAGQGVYDTETNVNDTVLHPYLDVGTGA